MRREGNYQDFEASEELDACIQEFGYQAGYVSGKTVRVYAGKDQLKVFEKRLNRLKQLSLEQSHSENQGKEARA